MGLPQELIEETLSQVSVLCPGSNYECRLI